MKRKIIFHGIVLCFLLFQTNMLTGQIEDIQIIDQWLDGPSRNPVKFKRYSYTDREGTGLEAFSFLMPVDWLFNGGLIWILDNPGMPATAAFTVSNSKGAEEFEVFPNQPFFWTTNQQLLGMFPSGSRYFGNEVQPVMNASQALQQIVLPRFRNHVGNLRVILESYSYPIQANTKTLLHCPGGRSNQQ